MVACVIEWLNWTCRNQRGCLGGQLARGGGCEGESGVKMGSCRGNHGCRARLKSCKEALGVGVGKRATSGELGLGGNGGVGEGRMVRWEDDGEEPGEWTTSRAVRARGGRFRVPLKL